MNGRNGLRGFHTRARHPCNDTGETLAAASRPVPHRVSCRRSFTLVELVVTLGISSILVLTVVSSLAAGRRLWHRIDDRTPYDEKARRITSLLRAELSGCYLPPEGDAGPAFAHRELEETGEATLSFFTTSPSLTQGLLPGRCARVTYEYRKLNPQGTQGVLIRREQTLASEKAISEPTAQVVADGLTLLAFQYDPGLPGGDASQNKVPRLIRVDFSFAYHDRATGKDYPLAFSDQFFVVVQGSLWVEKKK